MARMRSSYSRIGGSSARVRATGRYTRSRRQLSEGSMDQRRLGSRGLLLAACVLASSQLAAAQGVDDDYEVTVKMEIVGMPMAMPPVTQRLCVKKGAKDEDLVPKRENCRVTDIARTGSRLTFK